MSSPNRKTLRIFAAAPTLPRSDMAAGHLRFSSILEMMSQHHEVTLLVNWPLESSTEWDPYIQQLKNAGIYRIVLGFYRVQRLMALSRFDLGLFEFYHCDERVRAEFRRSQPGAPIVVDSVDLHYLREAHAARLLGPEGRERPSDKARELQVYAEADGVIMVTQEDDMVLKQELPSITSWLIPIPCPIITRKLRQRNRELLFVGGFGHAPNVDGITWFSHEIFPLIRSRVHDATLTIVGSDPPDKVQALRDIPGICVTGYVPETMPYLEKAAVSIAPLRYGAGMKGKVTEALAAAVPIATTSFGSQGFSAVHGEHLLLADDPREFADHVIKLLLFPEMAEAMGRNGQDLVSKTCSPEAVEQNVALMLQEAVSLRRPAEYTGQRFIYLLKVSVSFGRRITSRIAKAVMRKHN